MWGLCLSQRSNSISMYVECGEWIWCKVTYAHAHTLHDDVIKWKHFPRYWPVVRGIHRSPVTSPHKGQWCGALMFSLICARINGCVNNGEAGHLRRHRAHYDVIVMNMIYAYDIRALSQYVDLFRDAGIPTIKMTRPYIYNVTIHTHVCSYYEHLYHDDVQNIS